MAQVTVNSNLLANTYASPRVQNVAALEYGRERAIAATVAIANGDTGNATFASASVYRMFRVGSHWRCKSLLLRCTAVTGASISVGLIQNADVAPTPTLVVAGSNAVYASGVSIASAIAATPTELAYSVKTAAAGANLVWQDAGLSAAPQPTVMYELALHLTVSASAAGTVFIDSTWVVD